MTYFGAMQNEIYNAGLRGILPAFPVDFATLEQRAHEALGPMLTNYVAPVPILTAIVAISMLRAIRTERNSKPFWLGIALFFLGMSGLGVTIWPYAVPESVTIWEAAAPYRSQAFMLVGVALTMPLIIAYTAWAYWVFRGKVGHEGYH